MLIRLTLRSLWSRRARVATGFLATAIGCALAAAMLQVGLDARDKLQVELRVFGANLVLLPEGNRGRMPAAAVDRFAAALGPAHLRGCSPVLERPVRLAGTAIPLVGVRWAAAPALFAYWRIQGRWPQPGETGTCLVGTRLAARHRLQVGGPVGLGRGGDRLAPQLVGLIHSGDAAEEQCFLSLGEAQQLQREAESATSGLALVAGEARVVERLAARAAATAGVVARPIRALAAAEGAVLAKAGWLMGASALSILLLAGLAVLTTSAAAAMDREREMALLTALGWEERQALLSFLAEAAIVGGAAGTAGALLAPWLAEALSRSLFGVGITLRPAALLLSPVLGLTVALAGAALPARRVLRLEPAKVLRGE
jgi:putative ABC transport system permease protein